MEDKGQIFIAIFYIGVVMVSEFIIIREQERVVRTT